MIREGYYQDQRRVEARRLGTGQESRNFDIDTTITVGVLTSCLHLSTYSMLSACNDLHWQAVIRILPVS